jgi:hypothetical protein
MKKAVARPALIITSAGVCIALCANAVVAGSAAKPQPEIQKRSPVYGHLVLRNYRVTFKPGDRFRVTTRAGKVITEDATLAKLKLLDPALHEALQPIVAGDAFVYAGR